MEKDAMENMKPSAKLNLVMFTLQLAAFVVMVTTYGTGERYTAVEQRETYHTGIAALILFPVVVVELAFLASSILSVQAVPEGAPARRLTNFRVCCMTLSQYFIKMSTMAAVALLEGGIVHTDSLGVAGPRGVYTIRVLQWSISVPLMIAITNESLVGSGNVGDIRKRDFACMLNTCMYCWTSWAGEVCPAPTGVRVALMVLAWFGFLAACIDQIAVLREQAGKSQPRMKATLVAYELICFTLYGLIFFGARLGLFGSFAEACFYSYGDVTVKLFQGALNSIIRSRDDIITMCHWWATAAGEGEDLQNMMRSAAVPILSTTLAGEVTTWNDMVANLTGIPEERARGRPLFELVAEEYAESVKAAIEARSTALFHAGFDKAGIAEDDQRQDEKVKLILKFVVRRSKGCEPVGLTAIGQDLTEVITLRETEERNAKLPGVLSHELKSPLHGIIGLSSMLCQMEKEPARKKQLDMIRGSATRLRDMVSDIMEMTAQNELKRRGAEDQYHLEKTNLLGIIGEVLLMTKFAVNRANRPLVSDKVKLLNACPAQVPAVMGNSAKLTQLLYNLLTNACKFTQEGSVKIACRSSGKDVLVDIMDTGAGIEPCKLESIFLPFHQDSNNKSQHFDGIGLGLHICHAIAKAHKGRISVKSQLGVGSTFTLHLPALDEMMHGSVEQVHDLAPPAPTCPENFIRAPPAEPAKSVVEPATPAPAVLAQAHELKALKKGPSEIVVLSVDDCPVNHEVIKGALASFCRVDCAMHGQEALDYLRQHPQPALILLDVMMPVMDGFQTLQAIRSSTPRYCMPIVMISANADPDSHAVTAISMGADDYLVKPVCANVLRAKVMSRIKLTEDIEDNQEKHAEAVFPGRAGEKLGSMDKIETKPLCQSHGAAASTVDTLLSASANSLPKVLETPPMVMARPQVYDISEDDDRDSIASCDSKWFPASKVSLLRNELILRDKDLRALALQLGTQTTDLWLSERKIEALQRENDFLRGATGVTMTVNGDKRKHKSYAHLEDGKQVTSRRSRNPSPWARKSWDAFQGA
eukprot:TRINITY_DN6377_c0_g1_i1.p1 TRINITY_DN6377_c0_g1~~TRINITY_DN6377_c0_g1_i1.p1  ORF type:complete len:1042 (-),score=231.98 TRINITY_DN6377_c0_g1_i1:241-3366(-)